MNTHRQKNKEGTRLTPKQTLLLLFFFFTHSPLGLPNNGSTLNPSFLLKPTHTFHSCLSLFLPKDVNLLLSSLLFLFFENGQIPPFKLSTPFSFFYMAIYSQLRAWVVRPQLTARVHEESNKSWLTWNW